MDDISITTAILNQADEEILSTTVSDEALESAAGTDREVSLRYHTDNTATARTGGHCC